MNEHFNKIDPDAPESLPVQIKKEILSKISSGLLAPGERILSETKLAQAFKVSRITARQALIELINGGILVRTGRGTFVAEKFGRVSFPGCSMPVMVIAPNLKTSFYNELVSGCEAVLSGSGYELILMSVNENPIEEKTCLLKALKMNLLGVILIADHYSSKNLHLLDELNQKIPFLALDVKLKGLECDLVVSDDKKGGYLAVKHLIELGRRKILHLAGPRGDSSAEDRAAGYFDALKEAGIERRDELVRFTNWYFDDGYYEMKKFLKSSGVSVDAVFACNDEVAAGAYRALVELKKEVPEQVALAGYGNMECGKFLGCPLTTVDQSAYEMGKSAAELLIQRIGRSGPVKEHSCINMSTKLVVRQSCGMKLS